MNDCGETAITEAAVKVVKMSESVWELAEMPPRAAHKISEGHRQDGTTRAHADMTINIIISNELPMKMMVKLIGNLHMDAMNKMRDMPIKWKNTASRDRTTR